MKPNDSIKQRLAPFASQIGGWVREEDQSLNQVRERLEGLGCQVPLDHLERWWRGVEHKRVRSWLVASIAEAARHRAAAEKAFVRNPPPELEMVVKLCRALLLRFVTQAGKDPACVKIVTDLFKPVMDYARLEEKRKDRELAERKYQDLAQERERARKRDGEDKPGLTPETLEKIERELNLF
jgi:hypothetical protein